LIPQLNSKGEWFRLLTAELDIELGEGVFCEVCPRVDTCTVCCGHCEGFSPNKSICREILRRYCQRVGKSAELQKRIITKLDSLDGKAKSNVWVCYKRESNGC